MSLFTFSLFMFAGCTKSISGERTKWTYNMKRAEVVRDQFKGFAQVTNDIIIQAEQIFSFALLQDIEETKIEQMAKANKLLSTSYIRTLFQLENKINEARKLCDQLVKKNITDNDELLSLYDRAVLDQTITRLENQIKTATPGSKETANIMVQNMFKPLDEQVKEMKHIIRQWEAKSEQ